MAVPRCIQELRGRADEPDLGPTMEWFATDPASPLSRPDSYELLTAYLQHPMPFVVPGSSGTEGYKTLMQPCQRGCFPRSFTPVPVTSIEQGPVPDGSDILVIGKMPWDTEVYTKQLFSGESGYELLLACREIGEPDLLDRAFFTNVCRFRPPAKTLKASWLQECYWFLWAEINILRPRWALLLGSDAIKRFHGNRSSVSRTRGAMIPVEFGPDHTGRIHRLNTFCTIHPAEVARDPAARAGFHSDIAAFTGLTRGSKRTLSPGLELVDYRTVCTLDGLKELVRELLDKKVDRLAVDCEWAGRSPHSDGRLLTVQISWGPGTGACVVLHRHKRFPTTGHEASLTMHYFNTVNSPYVPTPLTLGDGEEHLCLQTKSLTTGSSELEALDTLESVYKPSEMLQASEYLRQLLLRPGVRLAGHNFRSDLPWLRALGVDCLDGFLAGYDTMLSHHLLHETVEQDLKSVALRYTDMGRYDLALTQWRTKYVGQEEEEHGFGRVPEHLLYEYAVRDVDATFRLWEALEKEYKEKKADRPLLESLRRRVTLACAGIAEMEATGLLADEGRILDIAERYDGKRREMEKQLKEDLRWPGFNTRSIQHVREFLFGEALNGAKRKDPATPNRIRPDGALSLGLTPIKSTDRPSISWSKVMSTGEAWQRSPSTDAETLGILAAHHPAAEHLRKIRWVDQICKNFVAPDKVDPGTGEVHRFGLARRLDPDMRIRTRIIQTLETGRWASRAPNLQNLPKAQEPALQRLFGEDPPKSIRSVFLAPPGHLIVEGDYSQAELVVLAMLSGDREYQKVLLETTKIPVAVGPDGKVIYWLHPEGCALSTDVVPGGSLPQGTVLGEHRQGGKRIVAPVPVKIETRKWKLDLHAETAIRGFQMSYDPVTDGPGKDFVSRVAPERRVAAKAINFGVNYGQQPPALYRGLKQDGVDVTEEDVKRMIDGFFARYQGVRAFLDRCQESVSNPGYLDNPFGRRRTFYRTSDDASTAKQEREAMNFPIQSTVAEALSQAVYNFWVYRQWLQHPEDVWDRAGMSGLRHPCRYLMSLGVHDAILFEVPVEDAEVLMKKVIPLCMGRLSPIPACANFGSPEFRLDVDVEMMVRWGEKMTPEDKARLGLGDKG